jgi:hypothetical protein
MIILPEVNTVYKFTFKVPFNYLNDIYRVNQILEYDEFARLDIDLYAHLYPSGMYTYTDYLTHLETYRLEPVYKITHPNVTLQTDLEKAQEKEIYIPKNIISNSPDPNVRAYSDLVLAVRIGPLKDVDKLTYIKSVIQENILYSTGINADIKLAALNINWLTDDEYELLEADRDQASKKSIDYFAETQKLQQQLLNVEAELLAYKTAILP